jgi:hypothetical protein
MTPTLYEWAGGEPAFARLIDCFFDRIEQDDLISLEWGTRLGVQNSQPGADVVRRAPVPRWGWGEAPPYQG